MTPAFITTRARSSPAKKAEQLYGPDQLGSVRDVDVVTPTVSAPGRAYDYDPYGNPTATPAGVPLTDFRYAGMFYPGNGAAEGGLDLTQYRAYDPRIARWLSRDPIGETGGSPGPAAVASLDFVNSLSRAPAVNLSPPPSEAALAQKPPWAATPPTLAGSPSNLYAYALYDPVNGFDPTGLSPVGTRVGFLTGGALGATGVGALYLLGGSRRLQRLEAVPLRWLR